MKRLLTILFLLSVVTSLYSQEYNVSYQFNHILFKDLVDTIEKEIPVKVYYTNQWTDSLYINISSENNSLNDFLFNALDGAGFSFVITEDNKIILSKGYSIKTNFQEQYRAYLKSRMIQEDTTTYVRYLQEEELNTTSDEYKVFTIGKPSDNISDERAVISGIVENPANGSLVAGAVVYIEKLKVGAVTNKLGYYSLSLPKGQYQIEYRMVGMRSTIRNIILYSNGNLNVQMTENTNQLNEVVVSANRENIVRNVRLGIEKINVKMLRQIPMGLGEVDLLKSSLLLPGVQTVGEASSGFNVRGGSADQNQVLLNNAPIINSSHFFGFFSAFNSDLIQDVTLYKSGMPAKFGGRLSSVMDIVTLEGNNEKVRVSGGISPVTGRLLVEGPIKKDKTTFIIGSRATYSDWILGMLSDKQLQNSTAGFYDIQGAVNTIIDEKNSFSLSGYYSEDRFDYYLENAFDYGNIASTLKWKHTFNQKLSAQFFAILSNYKYQLNSKGDSTNFNSMNYQLNQKIARADFLLFPADKHRVEFGLDAVFYSLQPGLQKPVGEYSNVTYKELEHERALEPSLYISDEFEISSEFSVSGGFRATIFTLFGPGTSYDYLENNPRSVETIIDTVSYRKDQLIKSYPGLEFRLSSRLIMSSRSSVKFGVQRVYQYMHMISNTTSMSPTDVWKLSDSYIKPQRGDQISLGMFNNLGRRGLETSVEVYYKWLKNTLDYKGGAVLLMNDHLETDIINGTGKAYGLELMIKKQTGSLTGWISYTWSRVLLKVDSPYESEKVNKGRYFPANYDKPHDLKIVANQKISRRLNITTNFVYNTGRPITFPVAFYDFYNTSRVYYSDRNEYRMPDYIRLDLSATLNGNLKARKLNHSSLTFTVYNVLGRRNPYSIFFKNENGAAKGYQMSIFGQPIAMVTYNFRLFGNATGDF